MRNLISIKKSRGVTSGRRAVARRLERMLSELDRRGLPPMDVLRGALAGEESVEDLGRAFLELCRLREYAEGLASISWPRIGQDQTDRDPASAVALYLLTGHLRPENDRLLQRFVASADFGQLASALYVLERAAPTDRFFYQYLFKKNLYSKDFADYWSLNAKRNWSYSQKFIKALKEANVEFSQMNQVSSQDKTKLKFDFKKRFSKVCSRYSRWHLTHSKFISENVSESKRYLGRYAALEQEKTFTGEERVTENESLYFPEEASTLKTTKEEKKSHSKSANIFQYLPDVDFTTKSDNPDVLSINIEKIEAQERVDNFKTELKIESRIYKEKHRLVKERTDFKYPEQIKVEGKKDILPSFRTNAATLLKEAATILKEEEEENKKILELIMGSSNYLEYEKMIKERMEDEKKLFQLKIQKLHLEGKLTDQAAILAKLRLETESKERRKEFEEERNKLLEDMVRLRENEMQRMSVLVEKVRDMRDRIAIKKKNLENEKKQAVEKLSREIRCSLRETMEKEKRELEKKVLMIKEVRAIEAFKKSLKGKHSSFKSSKSEESLGFLCEMSLEELAEKKKYMKEAINEEINRRRNHILEEIKSREMLLDAAEEFVQSSRMQRKLRRSEMSDCLMTRRTSEHLQEIPDTFQRPVPIVYEKEIAYKMRGIEVRDSQVAKKKEALKEKAKCENESKADANRYESRLNYYLKLKEDKQNLIRQGQRGFNDLENLGAYVNIKTIQKTTGTQLREVYYKRKIEVNKVKQSILNISFWGHDLTVKYVWEKFKYFINNFTSLRLPAKFQTSIMPPKKWMKENKKKIVPKRRKTKEIQIRKTSTRKSRISARKWRKDKSHKQSNVISEKKWIKKWKHFFESITHPEYIRAPRKFLEKLDDSYTKKIIKHINYYNNLSLNKTLRDKEKEKNSFIRETVDCIAHLKAKYEYTAEKVREARKNKTVQLGQRDIATEKSGKSKPTTSPWNQIVMPNSIQPRFVRNYEEKVFENPLFEAEDREIRETVLKPPLDERTQTELWIAGREDEESGRQKPPDIGIPGTPLPLWKALQWRPSKTEKNVNRKNAEVKMRLKPTYSLLKNMYGKPVFILKPSAKNLLKWEWHPIEVRKMREIDVAYECRLPQYINKLMTPVERRRAVAKVLTKSTQKAIGLLVRLQAMQIRMSDFYLRSMKGKERSEYFRNVPIRMLMDYLKEHPFGGDPNEKSQAEPSE